MNNYPTDAMTTMRIKDLEAGEWFKTSKKSKRVYEKGQYDRTEKMFFCEDQTDISNAKYFKSDKLVFTDFEF